MSMTSDPRDYKLELSSAATPPEGSTRRGTQSPARPFLSLLFACCNVYARVYRDANEPLYRGRCPRCGGTVTFQVAAGGTDSRFFIVK